MRRNLLSMLEHATVLQIGADSGMTTGRVWKGGSLGPPLNDVKYVAARHRIRGERVALFEAPEQRIFLSLARYRLQNQRLRALDVGGRTTLDLCTTLLPICEGEAIGTEAEQTEVKRRT